MVLFTPLCWIDLKELRQKVNELLIVGPHSLAQTRRFRKQDADSG